MRGMGSTRPLVGAVCILLAVCAVLLVGCGGGEDGAGQTSGSGSESGGNGGAKSVTISDFAYEPAELTVPKGTTVTFTNRDSAPHTATSKESGLFESGTIDGGKTGQVELEESGTFAYYCLFHPFMKGTIIVG
jgi:plastocyanin